MNWSRIVFRAVSAVLLISVSAAILGEENAGKAESLTAVDPVTKRKLGTPSKIEQNLLKYTNLARKKHDKQPLTEVSHLTVIAQRHAINMARQEKMTHLLDGESVVDRLKGVSYRYQTFGENISAGYPNEKATVEGWLSSSGHKANLLDEKNLGFTQIGIGAHRSANGRWYCCQVFARPVPGQQYD